MGGLQFLTKGENYKITEKKKIFYQLYSVYKPLKERKNKKYYKYAVIACNRLQAFKNVEVSLDCRSISTIRVMLNNIMLNFD